MAEGLADEVPGLALRLQVSPLGVKMGFMGAKRYRRWMARGRLVYWGTLLALAATYLVAAKFGLTLASEAEQVSVVWPPTGIAVAALLLLGRRAWPGITLGAFLANATAHEPLATAFGIAIGNTLEAVAAVWLLRRFIHFDNRLARIRDVLALVIASAVVGTAVSATIGVTSLCLGGVQSWSMYGQLWRTWWLGDAVGALVVAPLVLTWATAWHRIRHPERLREAAILLAAAAGMSLIVFAGPLGLLTTNHPLEFAVFPFIIWAALRFGQWGTATVTGITSAIAIWGTVRGWGPFSQGLAGENLALLQAFLAVVATTGLLLGAALAERNVAERRRAADHAVTQLLADSASLEDAAPRLLQIVCEKLEWDLGLLWMVDEDRPVLRCASVWHQSALGDAEFVLHSRQEAFGVGVGLPGRVWASGKPVGIADVTRADNFPRAAIAELAGIRGAFAFPILCRGTVVGAVEFFSREIRPPDSDLLQLFAAVGSQMGQFLDRQRDAQAVRESEERYRDLFENASDIIYSHDLHGNMTSFNRAGEQIFGYSREEITRMNLAQVLTPASVEMARSMTARKVAEGGRTAYELEAISKSGRTITLEISSRLILRDGKPVGVQGIARDATDRKRAEAALRESEERLRLALDAGHCGVWDWDIPNNRVTWSDRIYEFHDMTPGTFGGRMEDFTALVQPDDAKAVSEAIQKAVREGTPYTNEYRIVRRSGEVRWISTSGRVLYDGDGRPMRMLGANLDVTERRRTEEALRDADRRKDEFLAMLAHELRNPLAPLRNALGVLAMRFTDPDLDKVRGMMERQVEHLVRMVDDLLDVSRIMRGRIELRNEPVELTAIIARAVETARPAIDARGHELKVSFPSERVWIRGDLVRLAQIFANLLGNAAKYTERAGTISLSAESEDARVVISVRDSGIGIAPELLPLIFDLFVQGDRSIARSQGGLGIGLTLVRRLVELHGGTIRAASAGPGRGSEFVVQLPVCNAASPVGLARDDSATQRNPEERGQRVLVVDDNVDAAESLAMVLRLSGHEVRTAYNGPAALAEARAATPDVVLLDIGLPGMDGFDVARQIREDRGLNHLRIVAVTGYGQDEDRRRTQEAGFDFHLTKPVDPRQLDRLLSGSPADPRS
jgi:PAS domain S-box-containing protein